MYWHVTRVQDLTDILDVNRHLEEGWRILALYESNGQVHFILGSPGLPNT